MPSRKLHTGAKVDQGYANVSRSRHYPPQQQQKHFLNMVFFRILRIQPTLARIRSREEHGQQGLLPKIARTAPTGAKKNQTSAGTSPNEREMATTQQKCRIGSTTKDIRTFHVPLTDIFCTSFALRSLITLKKRPTGAPQTIQGMVKTCGRWRSG